MKLKVKNYLYRAILDSQKRKIKRKKKLLLSQNIVNNNQQEVKQEEKTDPYDKFSDFKV